MKHTICIAGHRFHTERQGGVEFQTRYIGEALSSADWKVAFLAPNTKGRSGKERIDKKTDVWWYPQFSYTFQAPNALIESMLDAIEPSVFYQRGRGQLLESGVILRYARKRSIPFVFALSSDMDLDPFYATKANLTAHKPMWKRLVLLPYSFWLDRVRGYVLKHSDHIIVQHEAQIQAVKEKVGSEPGLLRTIHPELDRAVHKPEEKTILWANNCRPLKQGEFFVRLAKRCRTLGCRFLMVLGRPKEEYIDPIRKDSQGTANLTLLEEIPPGEVDDLIEKAVLFVNTSTYEGFPNTFVQAWLRETPTVSLNVDPGRVLTKQKIGICSGNFEQLVRDVIYLVENDEDRLEMGKRARRYAEEMHGFSRNAGKIAAFFDTVVSGTKPRR